MNSRKVLRIGRHAAFWIFILALHIFRSGPATVRFNTPEFMALLTEHSLMLPLLMAISYFFAYGLLPRLLSGRRYLQLILMAIAGGAAAILIMRLILYYYIIPVFYSGSLGPSSGFWNFNLVRYTFYIFSTVAIVLMIRYTSMMRRTEQERNQLEKQKLASELALLRSQVNPHFLFNTLNNIHAIAIRDPERTSRSIIKLSDIMRYMIYEAAQERVPLISEIDYINNYTGLLALRLDRTDYIRFTVMGNPEGILIPPMLLIPFVENAFKHGSKEESPPGIILRLVIDDHHLSFSTENIIKPAGSGEIPGIQGTGISNLKRRLELLFPGKHRMEIREEEEKYLCRLELNLDMKKGKP